MAPLIRSDYCCYYDRERDCVLFTLADTYWKIFPVATSPGASCRANKQNVVGQQDKTPCSSCSSCSQGGWVDGASAGNTQLGMCRMSWHVHNKQVEHLTGYYEDEEEDEAAVKAEDEAQAEAADTVQAQVQEDEEKVKENETGREKMRQAENEFPAEVQEKTLFLIVPGGGGCVPCPVRTFSFMQRKSIISQPSRRRRN